MKTHFSFLNTDENCKKVLEDYVNEEKLQSLTRVLQRDDLDLADLDIKVEYFAHHNNFSTKINLKIGKRVFFSENIGHNLTEAFDLTLEKIVSQLRKLESRRHNT